ncbi:arginine--tRNA ligase [Candidatus Poribacteria bacterium]|nr:arginine--tRNA ligase [Candidatus Poribacteria bacterium]
MWRQISDEVRAWLGTALEAAIADGSLRLDAVEDVPIEQPGDPSHGDLASPIALQLARAAKLAPRAIATAIVEHATTHPAIGAVEIAGPGFINVRLSNDRIVRALRDILRDGPDFGGSATHAGKTALVEFVSANPTGPLTLGHGRQAAIGDTVARLLSAVGYQVSREYYFNDGGRQMRVLGQSVRSRYGEIAGRDIPFPEDGYQGEYIRDIARALFGREGNALLDSDDIAPFTAVAVDAVFADIRRTLSRLGIAFDRYFNELSLYETGAVERVADDLRRIGASYEHEGAIWFRATAYGGPQDRVIIRSTGEPTYRLPDIAYHCDKLRRNYDRIVDVFGADHIDTYPDVIAAVQALGFDASRIDVLIHQFVTITRGGETVKMSTRRANFVTVDELIDEVGEDAVRLFFVLRSAGTHLAFDVDLAKQSTNENPVYYLQYAHARIASIFRQAQERGIEADGDADASLLGEPEELALIKVCASFPDVVADAAEAYEPHRIPHYLNDVATAFHLFYDRCRVLDAADVPRSRARLALSHAAQTVLANGLGLLGVRAPERM